MRVFADDLGATIPVQWYRAPLTALPLPYATPFNSRVWDGELGGVQILGEDPATIRYHAGRDLPLTSGRWFCGKRKFWTEGASVTDPIPAISVQTGLPCCCGPAPYRAIGGIGLGGCSALMSLAVWLRREDLPSHVPGANLATWPGVSGSASDATAFHGIGGSVKYGLNPANGQGGAIFSAAWTPAAHNFPCGFTLDTPLAVSSEFTAFAVFNFLAPFANTYSLFDDGGNVENFTSPGFNAGATVQGVTVQAGLVPHAAGQVVTSRLQGGALTLWEQKAILDIVADVEPANASVDTFLTPGNHAVAVQVHRLWVPEVIVFPFALDDLCVASIQAYLIAKYAL